MKKYFREYSFVLNLVLFLLVTSCGGGKGGVPSADTTPPTLELTVPSIDETNFNNLNSIELTFNEDVALPTIPGDVFIHVFSNNSFQTGTFIKCDPAKYKAGVKNTVVFSCLDLDSGLKEDSRYKITVENIRDSAGNRMKTKQSWEFETVTHPAVIKGSSAQGINSPAQKAAIANSLRPTITIPFSEAISLASLENNVSLYLINTTRAIPAVIALNQTDASKVIITPVSDLVVLQQYVITIMGGDTGIKDLQNNPMDALKYDFNFTSAGSPDTKNPTAVLTSPSSTTDVSGKSNIIITFDEAILGSSLSLDTNILLMATSGNANTPIPLKLNYSYSVDPSNNKILLIPNANFSLTAASSYQLRLLNTITDTSGNPLNAGAGGEKNFNFSTALAGQADITLPYIVSVTPANNAVDVPTNSTISITFSEKMLRSSLYGNNSTSTFSLVEVINGSAGNISLLTASNFSYNYNAATNVVSFTQNGVTSALLESRQYNLYVKSGPQGVKDVASNNLGNKANTELSARAVYTFTTIAAVIVDSTPPYLKSSIPSDFATGVATNATLTVTFSESLDTTAITSKVSVLDLFTSTRVPVTSLFNITFDATTNSIILTNTKALNYARDYLIDIDGTITGIKDIAGNTLGDSSGNLIKGNVGITFTTVASPTPPPTTPVARNLTTAELVAIWSLLL